MQIPRCPPALLSQNPCRGAMDSSDFSGGAAGPGMTFRPGCLGGTLSLIRTSLLPQPCGDTLQLLEHYQSFSK